MTCACECVHMPVCIIHVCMYVHVRAHVHVCACKCMHVCVCLRVYTAKTTNWIRALQRAQRATCGDVVTHIPQSEGSHHSNVAHTSLIQQKLNESQTTFLLNYVKHSLHASVVLHVIYAARFSNAINLKYTYTVLPTLVGGGRPNHHSASSNHH